MLNEVTVCKFGSLSIRFENVRYARIIMTTAKISVPASTTGFR